MTLRVNIQLLLAQVNVERAKKGETPLTFRQLAIESGITPSVVSTLATGRTRRIDFDTIDRLLAYFNRYIDVNAGDLLVWTGTEPDI